VYTEKKGEKKEAGKGSKFRWQWVQELPGFEDDPNRCNEKILESIQMAWLDERE